MTNEIQHILDECKLALDDVNDKNLSEFSNVEKGIKISRKYLQQLRVVLRKRNFINNENEILFFKKQKRLKNYLILKTIPMNSIISPRTQLMLMFLTSSE